MSNIARKVNIPERSRLWPPGRIVSHVPGPSSGLWVGPGTRIASRVPMGLGLRVPPKRRVGMGIVPVVHPIFVTAPSKYPIAVAPKGVIGPGVYSPGKPVAIATPQKPVAKPVAPKAPPKPAPKPVAPVAPAPTLLGNVTGWFSAIPGWMWLAGGGVAVYLVFFTGKKKGRR